MDRLALVINLKHLPEKWNVARDRLWEAGFRNIERLDAVYGKNVKDLKKEGFSASTRLLIQRPDIASGGRDVHTLGAAGCSLSHVKCWRRIVDENLPGAFIFEDDVLPLPGSQENIERWLSQGKDNSTMYWFGYSDRVDGNYGRSQGYYIPKIVAQAFLDAYFPIHLPIDLFFSDMMREKDVPIEVPPSPVMSQIVIEGASTTTPPGDACWKCSIPDTYEGFQGEYTQRAKHDLRPILLILLLMLILMILFSWRRVLGLWRSSRS
jgi:GR25 family glycosyltransferase involved in LPS biosynthesis